MNAIALPNALRQITEAQLPAPLPTDPFLALPESKREQALDRQALIKPVLARKDLRVEEAAAHVFALAEMGQMPHTYLSIFLGTPKKSVASFARWARAYKAGGILALAPKHKGRERKESGWETRALALFQQPTRPSYSTVALWLREEGHADASDTRVRRFLKRMPSNQAETSPRRVGRHHYSQNIRPHVVRDTTQIPVGFIYEGDGHTCDVYVAHPITGRSYRPELTVWLDIRSHYVVGWWLSESESSETTLFSLSHALIAHNHTPAYAHTDPGSGFKSRLITDEVYGFLARFQISPIFALPGNAKGKGLTEGWFRWFEERCGKRFETYCGHERTDDALRRMQQKLQRGELELPTFEQYADAVRSYIESSNRAVQESLGDRSPADVWAQLERVELETPAAAVVRPRVTRIVKRWGVSLQNRLYRSADLAALEGREVVVEYSLHDDARVAIHERGLFVCEAPLIDKKPWLPASRIEEGQQRRLAGQRSRLEARLAEAEARSRAPIAGTAAGFVGAIADAEPLAVERVEQLRRDESEATAPEETPDQRYARARSLESNGRQIAEADAQWLSIYQTSAEYHSRRALQEEFGGSADTDPPISQPALG
jgi:putative transposase